MLKNLGVVQACSHVPHYQCRAARKLDGRPILEWVIRRATECQRLDGVIVLACDCPDHRFLRSLVPTDVPIFSGDQPDSLGRFAKALEAYPAEAVIRIRGDNLFTDPALIDRLVNEAEKAPDCDYVSFSSHDGRPAIQSPVGIYAEWVRAKALRKAAERSTDAHEREQVTRYIYDRPQKFSIRLLPAPSELDRADVRLRIDQEEDWDHMTAIYEALGPEGLDWRRIASLLSHHPTLRSRMAVLNRDCDGPAW